MRNLFCPDSVLWCLKFVFLQLRVYFILFFFFKISRNISLGFRSGPVQCCHVDPVKRKFWGNFDLWHRDLSCFHNSNISVIVQAFPVPFIFFLEARCSPAVSDLYMTPQIRWHYGCFMIRIVYLSSDLKERLLMLYIYNSFENLLVFSFPGFMWPSNCQTIAFHSCN